MTATRTIAVTVRLGQNLATQLEAQATLEGTTHADVLRRALERYVEQREQRLMLDDLRKGLLDRLEALEHCVVREINSLVELDADNSTVGGAA
ncbi:MAG: hypothetical protein JSS31_10225 [Proteobacteria bacterium]|nr:hypothetical protein [Pseudomonadota bacterium]